MERYSATRSLIAFRAMLAVSSLLVFAAAADIGGFRAAFL
jgi:hypothetical protein